MPALIKYERKPLTDVQMCALRDYIARQRLKEQNSKANGAASAAANAESDKDREEPLEVKPAGDANGPAVPPPPTAQDLREEKERCLKDLGEQLAELERTLESLKQKKHELFEEFKLSLWSANESKKQAEERQLHPFPSPFIAQTMGQMMNVSPYRPAIAGMKQPKSPSPPLVQLYSPGRSSANMQPSYDPLGSPAQGRSHHPAPPLGTFNQSDVLRSPFHPMGNKMSGHPDGMVPGYQFLQNFSPRDPRQQVHASPVNPHTPTSPRTPGPHYPPHERPFMEPRHPHDRPLPGMSGHVGGGMNLQNVPRQSMVVNRLPFMQQNMQLSGQPQQGPANASDGFTGFTSFGKERPGFGNSSVHRPQGYMKRGGHPPNRSSRYY